VPIPVTHRRDERLLDDVFGELQVCGPENAGEDRNEPAGLAPEERFDVGRCRFTHKDTKEQMLG
jgi:hypothetical protein